MKKLLMCLLTGVLAVCTLTSCNEQKTEREKCERCGHESDELVTIKIDDGIHYSESGNYYYYDYHFENVCEHCAN